ncbi:hypothetical protein ASE85_03280 [Sphingobium sp. Leaf26]|uniref:hypothetical protein n=1 Tax=Sphingobium sp. Leaf26 TaxID=1735693 RepID=UPI0006F3F6B5|nr:hypothetical protein [Sphingobium sp. Leaf26]KQN09966.1 hypothetical protein ASE85_03280 [Sphingobium sp. Leaf26]
MITFDASSLIAGIAIEDGLTEQEVEDVANKIGFDIFGDLVLETAVDTGEARNGWTIDDSGPVIVVENRVPHIVEINNGHSSQTPAGYVEAAVARHSR